MTEKVEREANDTVSSEVLEMNPELEGIGNYEYGWQTLTWRVRRQSAASTRPLCAIFP